jgi:molybdopterin converting factor small subunit
MRAQDRIVEIHDLTGSVARHYAKKYGDEAVSVLEEAARVFEDNDDIHGRNKMLRLRDEILMLPSSKTVE